MNALKFPKIEGGKISDAIFNEQGHITEMWVKLDPDSSEVSFPENFTVTVGCSIHVGVKTETIAK